MSGRAYTMKEMKGIVDYLVENNCYSEYRGRKMWVDYANSDKTSRTWQSLKETFLKRILPDIHNPYYKLHLDEIRSFRVSKDVTGKPINKLLFETASEDSSNVQEKASTSQNKSNEASNGPGEKIQASSNRESVETIILGTDEPAPTTAVATPTKISLRDRIQYADEPVVHTIRDILHDFSASDEDQTVNQEKSNKETKDTTPSKSKGSSNEEKKESPSKKSLRLKKKENKNENTATKEDTDKKIVTRNGNQTVTSPNKNVTVGKQDVSADQSTTNASNTMPDSLLPNNPEALKDNNPTRISNEAVKQPKPKTRSAASSTTVTRKRIRKPSVSSDSILKDPPINHTGSPKKDAPTPPKKNEPIDAVVVTTIMVNDSEELRTDDNKPTKLSSQQSTNPCLQSVSLFAEQFLEANSDSETDINSNSKNSSHSKDLAKESPTILKPIATIDKKVATKNVVVLESHSESASDDNTQPAKQESPRAIKTQSRLINNLFGSTSGGMKRNRHRNSSHRNRVNRHYVQSSGSSEWTSESDSDCYVSPPRSRSRLARKYLKPQSARILSLEEDGGLFVVSGKKVFPLINDGKSGGTYLTSLPERDSDEEKDSYWQLKYVKERKKTTELTKILQNIKHGEINRSRKPVAVDSPILQSNPSNNQKRNQKSIVINDDNSGPEEEVKEQALAIPSAPKEIEEEQTVKIKFAKDNEEVQVEGHWRSLHPILGDVLQMFNKKVAARAPSPSTLADKTEAEDVHKMVDALEAKILKETEEWDAKDLHRNEEMEKNITESRRKRGRPKSSTRPSGPTARASKRLKGSTESAVSLSSGSEVLVTGDTDTRRTRNKLAADNANSTTSKDDTPTLANRKSDTKVKPNDGTPTVQGRKSIAKQLTIMNGITPQGRTSTEGLEKNAETSPRQLRKSTQKDLKENGVASAKDNNESLNENDWSPDENAASINEGEAATNEDSQILYKFPSPVPEKKPVGKPKKPRKYFRRTPNIFSSPENISHQSADSSQGYQDSDNSPLSGMFRRKKKFCLPTNLNKTRKYNRLQRRKTLIHIECDASSESSNTSFGIPARSITIQDSSLPSDVYRSESYQLLMPLARSFRPLEKISESSPCPNVVDSQQNSLNLSPASQNMECCSVKSHSNDIEVGNSSNVTLPLSPELSIVENISVAKDTLCGDFPTINETQKNCGGTYNNQYDISEVDVSVPLMEQDCTFRMNYQKRQSVSRLSVDMHTQQPDSTDIDATETIPATGTGVTVSQSLLEKIDTVSIEAQTTTDSLDTRLGNLLLESAKKIALQNKIMVDAQSQQTDHVKEEPAELQPKSKSRKRCSTPHKRKVPKKSQLPTNPVIEEQMEFCSSSRKSCPPVMSVLCAENPAVDPNSGKTAPVPAVATIKPRRTKEIIKVKILRPKSKQGKKNRSTLSVQTDSGINDTTASGILHSFNSTVELIHNHSETCLHAQECLHCSVEFVENTPQSIISLDSSSMHSVESDKENLPNVVGNKSLCAQFFSTDAQDASCLTIGSGMTSRSGGAAHLSGASMNSLMTEDRSPPPAGSRSPSSWRLLSEEEDSPSRDPLAPAACCEPTTRAISKRFGDSAECETNNFGDPTGCANTVGYGSNLRQLFPIACAVPDLSTITEQSRETDCNSRGFKMDTNTRNEFLALDNLMEGNQEEFFTCPSDI